MNGNQDPCGGIMKLPESLTHTQSPAQTAPPLYLFRNQVSPIKGTVPVKAALSAL